MEMYSGTFVDFDCLKLEQFCIDDIAVHLSQTCRFGGGTRRGDEPRFYSVAEHSVMVSHVLADRGAHPEYIFAGLMHDAHEAYVGDIPTPLKRLFGAEYKQITRQLDDMICRKFDINRDVLHSAGVIEADAVMLTIETWHMTASGGEHVEWSGLQDVSTANKIRYRPQYLYPEAARLAFLGLWNALSTERHLARKAPRS